MKLRDLRTGLTFDDVLIVPQRSSIRSRSHVSVRTRLSRSIPLDLPVIAANMDTVCEHEMAIAMGRLGGAGIVHRFMPIDAQAAQIAAIKNADDGSLVAGGAVGTDHDMGDRAKALVAAGADVLVLDIAHGHADHAIDLRVGKGLKELAPHDRRGGQVLVDPGQEADVVVREMFAGTSESEIVSSEGRALISGDPGRRLQARAAVTAHLLDRQAHEGLDSGHVNAAGFQCVLVVQREIARHAGSDSHSTTQKTQL